MLQAMNTGHDGSLSTVHANSPRDALSRLETMVMMAGLELPLRAVRQQIVIGARPDRAARAARGRQPPVTAIIEVQRMESDVITLQELFKFKIEQITPERVVIGSLRSTGLRPTFLNKFEKRGVSLPVGLFRGEFPLRRQRDTGAEATRALEVTRRSGVGLLAALLSASAGSAAAAPAPRLSRGGGATLSGPRVHPRRCRPKHALTRVGGDRSPRTAAPVRPLPPSRLRATDKRERVGGGARDRRVAEHAGQADRRCDRRRAGVRPPCNPDQPLAIVTFNDKVHVLQPFTTDPAKIAAALRTIPQLAAGHEDLRRARPERSALIDKAKPAVVGRSCCSPTAPTSAASRSRPHGAPPRSRQQHVRVFSVGLASQRVRRRRRSRRVADASGGSVARARPPAELKGIFGALGAQPRRASTCCATGRSCRPASRSRSGSPFAGLPAATASYVDAAARVIGTRRAVQPVGGRPGHRSPRWTVVVVALISPLLVRLGGEPDATPATSPLVRAASAASSRCRSDARVSADAGSAGRAADWRGARTARRRAGTSLLAGGSGARLELADVELDRDPGRPAHR